MPRVGAVAAIAVARHGATETLPDPLLHSELARRASALASPPPRRHAELGTRLLDVRGAPPARVLRTCRLVSHDRFWFVDQQDFDFTALMIAAAWNNEGCVRLLLESKASVNATNVSLERDALPQERLPWTS